MCLEFFSFTTKTGRKNWEGRLKELGELEESHPKKLEGGGKLHRKPLKEGKNCDNWKSKQALPVSNRLENEE